MQYRDVMRFTKTVENTNTNLIILVMPSILNVDDTAMFYLKKRSEG